MTKEMKIGSYVNKDNAKVKFNYVTNLTASEKIGFVNFVSNTIVTDDVYYSFLRDLIFEYEIINSFTDIDLSFIQESLNSIDEMEDFVTHTNIVDIVLADMERGLYEELNSAIDRNIEYKTGVRMNTIEDSISSFLSVVESKLEGIDFHEFIESVNKMSGAADDFTPEKIIEAYANTDLFKANAKKRQKFFKKNN